MRNLHCVKWIIRSLHPRIGNLEETVSKSQTYPSRTFKAKEGLLSHENI